MARERTLLVGALNLSVNPHPRGIYLQLLSAAAGKKLNFRGSDWAKFTTPTEDSSEPGVYTGRILVWTEIDTDKPWLNDETDEALSEEDKQEINIPEKAKPNHRVFNYIFRNSSHRIYVELRNEFGENLGITSATKIFFKLTRRRALSAGLDLDVTPIPAVDAVQRVLQLPGLRSLHIRVIYPNEDTVDPEKVQRVLRRLLDAEAKQLDEIYTKKAGQPRLIATSEIQETAEVAASNGFVKGVGREDGKRVDSSTTEQPRVETIPAEQSGTSFLSRLMGSIGLF